MPRDDDETTTPMLASDDVAWQKLPPLPARKAHRHQEALCGTLVVLGIIAGCVSCTRKGTELMVGGAAPPSPARAFAARAFMSAVLAEAAVALACLAGLLFDDAGEVRRSAATCVPVPPAVADRVRAGAGAHAITANIADDALGTYCVRCLVWRPPNSTPHHCSTCQVGERSLSPQNVPSPERCPTRQRCVTAFDHHCGVFGRCIAGEGLRGNWKYFVTIISMGLGGMATGVGAVMLGMYWARDDAQLWGSATSIALMIVAGYMGLWVAVTLLGALCWCLSRPFLALQSRFGANRIERRAGPHDWRQSSPGTVRTVFPRAKARGDAGPGAEV